MTIEPDGAPQTRAKRALIDAQKAYLVACGWVEDWTGHWLEPNDGHRGNGRRRTGRLLDFQHAVNSQLYADRYPIEAPYARPQETPEEKVARLKQTIRGRWKLRWAIDKDPRSERGTLRQFIRSIARTLGEAGAVMPVQKARLGRAMHAQDHKRKGCSCGREGAPW
jgi:hypothetical protein